MIPSEPKCSILRAAPITSGRFPPRELRITAILFIFTLSFVIILTYICSCKVTIFFGNENSNLLKKFNKEKTAPYSVFLDFNDKILISKSGMITDTEYYEIINYTLLGLTVGNEVGNICINKEIGIVGSDETFSIINNKGKIVKIGENHPNMYIEILIIGAIVLFLTFHRYCL